MDFHGSQMYLLKAQRLWAACDLIIAICFPLSGDWQDEAGTIHFSD